jgi:hypothetical protein
MSTVFYLLNSYKCFLVTLLLKNMTLAHHPK